MRRAFLLVLFVLALAVPSVLAQDPVKVDSKHYKVEFENSQVRVLRIKYGPHEKSVMHRHPNSVAIFLTDIHGKFTFPNGKTQDITPKQVKRSGRRQGFIFRRTQATNPSNWSWWS